MTANVRYNGEKCKTIALPKQGWRMTPLKELLHSLTRSAKMDIQELQGESGECVR
jgi:hypothetical protein